MSRFFDKPHSQKVHENDCPTAWAFFNKHGLGSKLPPSCLVCGQLPADADDIAIRHMELPNIIVCMTCRNAAQSATRPTHPNGLWIIYYEDASVKPEVFFGEGAEAAARGRFEQAQMNWSCHLLSRVPTVRESEGRTP